jgi:hypothetical protein
VLNQSNPASSLGSLFTQPVSILNQTAPDAVSGHTEGPVVSVENHP